MKFGIWFEGIQKAIPVILNALDGRVFEKPTAGAVEVDEVWFAVVGDQEIETVKVAVAEIDGSHSQEHFMNVVGDRGREGLIVIEQMSQGRSVTKLTDQNGSRIKDGACF